MTSGLKAKAKDEHPVVGCPRSGIAVCSDAGREHEAQFNVSSFPS
jgi:hypothetical protein